jgi:hypothetical protein
MQQGATNVSRTVRLQSGLLRLGQPRSGPQNRLPRLHGFFKPAPSIWNAA